MGKKEPLRISVDKAKQRSDKNESVFLDVVDPGSYEETGYRIEGAVRIDPRDVKEDYQKLPEDHEILTYCT